MKKLQIYWQDYFPWIIAALTSIGVYYYLPHQKILIKPDLLSSLITIFGIGIGTLVTSMSILISMNPQKLFKQECYWEKQFKYFKQGLFFGLLFLIFCITLSIFNTDQNLPPTYIPWIHTVFLFFLSLLLSLFYKIIKEILDLIKIFSIIVDK